MSGPRRWSAPGPVVLYGAGAFARELAWHVEECRDAGDRDAAVLAMVDDDPATHGRTVNGYVVTGLEDARLRWPEARLLVAVGGPQARAAMAARAERLGFPFATMIHPRVERSRWLDVGEGTVVLAGATLSVNVTLGRHVQVNPGCNVAHDAVLGDFASLAPGVRVSGHVRLGRCAYVGTGASIVNGSAGNPLVVGDDATIGAGACVTRPVAPGTTVVGVPARPLDRRG